MMGRLYSHKTIPPSAIFNLPSPIVVCSNWCSYEAAIKENGYTIFALNVPLAKELQGKSIQHIRANITQSVIRLLSKQKLMCLINYEMLFDPRYKLDVIRLFCELSKYNELIIKWCGLIDEETLIYAQPAYDDYVTYRIGNYEISCIN